MEGHAKTYTIPHPSQPGDRFFNSSPVKALESVFPPLGTPRAAARFETWEGSSSSHDPNFSREAASAKMKENEQSLLVCWREDSPADNNGAVGVIASRLRDLHYLR